MSDDPETGMQVMMLMSQVSIVPSGSQCCSIGAVECSGAAGIFPQLVLSQVIGEDLSLMQAGADITP